MNSSRTRIPSWVQMLKFVIERLPVGRYVLMNWIGRKCHSKFWMEFPRTGKEAPLFFRCDLRSHHDREVCFTGHYEAQETIVAQYILKQGMVFVDVGANWGYFTLFASQLVGQVGKVLSIEPHPQLFMVLQENVDFNSLKQVTCLQIAASDKEGFCALIGYEEDSDNRGISRLASDKNNSVVEIPTFTVACESLDSVLQKQNMTNVDLLKMDIEGAEMIALQGLKQNLMQQKIKRIILELHPGQLTGWGFSPEMVMEFLQNWGYRGYTIDYSPATIRKAAYNKIRSAKELLKPLKTTDSLDAWPHQLWLAPGVAEI